MLIHPYVYPAKRYHRILPIFSTFRQRFLTNETLFLHSVANDKCLRSQSGPVTFTIISTPVRSYADRLSKMTGPFRGRHQTTNRAPFSLLNVALLPPTPRQSRADVADSRHARLPVPHRGREQQYSQSLCGGSWSRLPCRTCHISGNRKIERLFLPWRHSMAFLG